METFNAQLLLHRLMSGANVKIFSELTKSFLRNPFAITTRSLARYSSYSLRQIFRFLGGDFDWYAIRTLFFMTFFYNANQHYLLAIDETVEKKSGKSTHGKDFFYSSTAQAAIKSVCFFALSVICPTTRKSFSLGLEQVIQTADDKKRLAEAKKKRTESKKKVKEVKAEKKEKAEKKKSGRPKGSKNKSSNAEKEPDNASYRTFKTLFSKSFEALEKFIPKLKVTHLLADSAYAAFHYLQKAQEKNIFLISKLHNNAALYTLPVREKGQKGRPRVCGEKLNLRNLSEEYFVRSEKKEGNLFKIYQFKARSKSYKGLTLNIVVLRLENEQGKVSINVLFSNDLTLQADVILNYYSLRFQIEFDFRDAKQHFGLSDFKNYKEKNMTNFVNLSFTMTLIVKKMLHDSRAELANEKIGIIDLKLFFHAQFQAESIINILKKDPTLINKADFIDKIQFRGYINAA